VQQKNRFTFSFFRLTPQAYCANMRGVMGNNSQGGAAMSKKDAGAGDVERIVKEKTTRMLKCELTQDELLALGAELADAQATIRELELSLKEMTTQHKSKVAVQDSIAARSSTLIRQRYEVRKVDCETVTNWKTETVTVTRLDSNEVVESRPMTLDEKSMLPL
jgi:hypothetical protein